MIRTAKDDAERFQIESQLKAPPAWDKKPTAVQQQRQTAKSWDGAAASLASLQGED